MRTSHRPKLGATSYPVAGWAHACGVGLHAVRHELGVYGITLWRKQRRPAVQEGDDAAPGVAPHVLRHVRIHPLNRL